MWFVLSTSLIRIAKIRSSQDHCILMCNAKKRLEPESCYIYFLAKTKARIMLHLHALQILNSQDHVTLSCIAKIRHNQNNVALTCFAKIK